MPEAKGHWEKEKIGPHGMKFKFLSSLSIPPKIHIIAILRALSLLLGLEGGTIGSKTSGTNYSLCQPH